jgi:hypothetical protein
MGDRESRPQAGALTEQAVSDLAVLSDDQLTGALPAARRLENRAAYLQTVVIAEFARRRDVEREEAKSRKVPLHCRPGQFPKASTLEMKLDPEAVKRRRERTRKDRQRVEVKHERSGNAMLAGREIDPVTAIPWTI